MRAIQPASRSVKMRLGIEACFREARKLPDRATLLRSSSQGERNDTSANRIVTNRVISTASGIRNGTQNDPGQSGRQDLNQRPLRPEDSGLLILAAEPNPSKSRFSFELGKVSINTSLTYIVHRLHELARITRDSVPDTVPPRRPQYTSRVRWVGDAVGAIASVPVSHE